MSSSAATFPARFAELVYLLANQPDATAEQESALDAAASAVTDRYASLTTSQLNVDLLDVGQTMVGVHLHELVMRMSAHSAHQIDFLANTPRTEILGVAQILASEARPNDDGAAFDEKFVNLAPTLIEVHLGRNGFVRAGSLTPPATVRVDAPPERASTPLRGVSAFGAPIAPRAGGVTPAQSQSVRATPMRGAPPHRPVIRDESSRIIEGALKSKALALMSDDELIEQLRTGVTPQNVIWLLEELAEVAEARASEHRWEVVSRIFDTFVKAELAAEHDPELRRAYAIGLRRIGKPTLIRGIASLLPRRRDLRDTLHDVFVRLGADGAEALIDLLTTSDVLTDRRAYLAALAKCRDAVPTLIHLLGDNRWFVVRNAADLLGEMRAPEAENALIDVVTHREERVRRSVATALARLGTARSMQASQQMLADPVPEVRVHAVQALGSTKWPRLVAVLSRALDIEQDAEVQAVILAALGRQASNEAVERLTRAAEPEGRLFRRKPTALRVSAIQALAEANTPEALAALKRFADDKEREVRDAALRALRPKSEG